MRIYKFGGASVKDAQAVKNVYEILQIEDQKNLVVVISAMGKTTNALEVVWKAYLNNDVELSSKVDVVKQYHQNMISELFGSVHNEVSDEVNNLFVELEWILEEEPDENKDFIYDQIVSLGELLSTRIVEAYLRANGLKTQWIDARSYLKSDNQYREAEIDWELSSTLIKDELPKILDNNIIITQGFIACTSENYTTTLGREGSDYTAAIFANILNAESVTIWKDVPGVLTADPKIFEGAVKLDDIPYAEAIEMTYYGATVIHPKTIKPLQNKKIPLLVKPFLAPTESGTAVGRKENVEFKVPIVILKKNQKLISFSTNDFSFIAENNLTEIIGTISKLGIKINTMQNSAMTFSICIDDSEKSELLIELLKSKYKIMYNDNIQLITIRHYNETIIQEFLSKHQLMLEQRSRSTIQLVLK
jgi:aspartate kinase